MNRSERKEGGREGERGFAVLTSIVLFLAIAAAVVAGVSSPVVRDTRNAYGSSYTKESFYLAEAGIEDALYRIKTGKTISSTETITLNGNSATTDITDVSGGKTITAEGESEEYVRSLEARLTTGEGVAFSYGIQTGRGGFVLNGGSTVNGSIYANGDIIATNGVTITGSATAANSAALYADQSNTGPTTPTNSINFRNASASEDFAQQFEVSTDGPINKVRLYIKKNGSPGDATVRIVTDSGNSPSTTNVLTSNGSLASSQVTTSYGWVEVVFPSNPDLAAGTKYWLVIDNGGNSASNYYTIAANSSTYASGLSKAGKYSGTWNATSPSTLDAYFEVYLGGLTATIGGDTWVGGVVIGSGGVGNAWAHTVQGASVAGTIYCQTGSYNSKSCNTSLGDPSPQGFPVSDANIESWKDDATAGGTIAGNYSVGWAGATLGPKKITGNLTVNGGGTLVLTGTLYVTGSVTVSGGGKIQLSSTYGAGSGLLISDGIVNLGGGGNLSGSGTSGSYLLILTTSDCPTSSSCGGANAITLSGGAGAVILNAQNGTIGISGGTSVKEATAYKITATGGATINYETGLMDVNFSSGPTGGWNISSWGESE